MVNQTHPKSKIGFDDSLTMMIIMTITMMMMITFGIMIIIIGIMTIIIGLYKVGSYLLLNTIFHWMYSVVLPIVFCAKACVIFVCSVVLLANREVCSMSYDTTPLQG